MARPLPAWSSPAVGTLFSARHATTHASQPVQRSRSTTIPHLRAINLPGYRRQFWILDYESEIANPKSKLENPKSTHLRAPSNGFSRIPPANRTSLPGPTRAIFTRVAAQANAPVSDSTIGARIWSGFAPRRLA